MPKKRKRKTRKQSRTVRRSAALQQPAVEQTDDKRRELAEQEWRGMEVNRLLGSMKM